MFQKCSQITLSGEVQTTIWCYDNVDEAISFSFLFKLGGYCNKGKVHKVTKAIMVTITLISRRMN